MFSTGSQANMWPKQYTVTASVGDTNVPLVFESFDYGITVQWEFNGQQLHGQTTLERDISEVTQRDEGIYECFQSDFQQKYELLFQYKCGTVLIPRFPYCI